MKLTSVFLHSSITKIRAVGSIVNSSSLVVKNGTDYLSDPGYADTVTRGPYPQQSRNYFILFCNFQSLLWTYIRKILPSHRFTSSHDGSEPPPSVPASLAYDVGSVLHPTSHIGIQHQSARKKFGQPRQQHVRLSERLWSIFERRQLSGGNRNRQRFWISWGDRSRRLCHTGRQR